MTELVTATATRNEGVDLNEFLNGRTATSDLLNGISDFADEYAAVRSYWYNQTAPPGAMPITPAGTALTYDRAVNYQTTGSVSFSGTGVVVVSNAAPTLTGTIVDRVYGNNSVSWNTIRFPDGIGISGGSHNGFGSLNGRGWRAMDDLTLIFPNTLSGTQEFADVFGNVTITDGITFTVASDATLAVNATATQIAMFTINNSLGLGTLTFNEVEAPVTNTVNIDTTVGGYYAILIEGAEVEGMTRFEAGSTVSHDYVTPTYSQGNSIHVYIKYDSNVATNTYYTEQVVPFVFNAAADTPHTVNVPVPVATALVGSAITTLPSNIGIASSYLDGTDADNPNTALVTITNSTNASLGLGETVGLALAATVGNEAAYFTSWYKNRASSTNPIITYEQSSIVSWDSGRITFASGNVDGGFRLQHVVRNWGDNQAGNFALSRTGASEVSPQIDGAASISTVIAALDASQTATSVEDIKNYAGYRSQNPLHLSLIHI